MLAAVGLSSRLVCAKEKPALQVQLILHPCLEVDPTEVRRLLRVELDAELLLPSEPVPSSAPRAAVTCEERMVRIQIEDPITGKSLGRRLPLETAAVATRARLLALALAELLLASWAELAFDSAAAPLPPAPPLAPAGGLQAELTQVQARQAASEQVRRHTHRPAAVQLGLQAAVLSFPGEGGPALFGATLRVAGSLRYRLHWQLDVHGHYGPRAADAGSLSVALFGGALALHYEQPLGAWRLRAGGGGRLAAAWLRGQPSNATQVQGLSLWGPVAGPMLRFSAARTLPRSLNVELELEGGYAPIAVRGNVDGVRALAIEGPWVGIALGVNRIL